MPEIITLEGVNRFLDRAPSIRVLVVGDCMLDAYVSGAASRISPEAPVPIVNVSGRRYVPGGAANVAANARAMGAEVALAGVTGVDDSGIRLRQELERRAIGMDALVEDAARTTITKTRITAAGQQIVRFDDEDLTPLPAPLIAELRDRCEGLLAAAQVCVISDYAKGVASDAFCRWLIDTAARRGVPVVVDPKSRDLARYRGASVITPNLKEALEAAALPLGPDADLAPVARLILPRIAPSALLVTRGEAGMSLFENGKQEIHLPALVNEVADVTGAGDTVVSALAIALGAGLSLEVAAGFANIAAGIAVGHHGTWAVRGDELREAGSKITGAARAC
jgi:D-beta-D-heptose 7-phosphate kinase/D-beta-D-heptose 1-phosphate adenosyltransferase